MPSLDTTNTRALLFDVFGTCVDWRTTVTTALYEQTRTTLSDPTASLATAVRLRATDLGWVEWTRFAQEWRNSYKVFVRGAAKALEEAQQKSEDTDGGSGAFKSKSVDEHHLESLQQLLAEWQLEGLWTPAQVQRLSLVWHYLAPWADTPSGIEALNSITVANTALNDENNKLITATLSNGNTALQHDLAAHARLPFTHLFSANDDFAAYKPHPNAYLGAARRLGLRPDECALVAAHLGDLKAAAACGLGTVYVERLEEEDWGEEEAREAREWIGLWVGEGEGGFERVVEAFSSKNK